MRGTAASKEVCSHGKVLDGTANKQHTADLTKPQGVRQAKDALANWKRAGRRTPALARSIGELDAKDVHLPELQAKRVRFPGS